MKISFTDILTQNEVVVPIIQRDYAQGRSDAKSTTVRQKFLEAIFSVIQSALNGEQNAVLELDFIYGYRMEGKPHSEFYPIDGQQRLTTLWLLYWYASKQEKADDAETAILQKFRYETRHSTQVFCQKLTSFSPEFSYPDIVQEIKDQPWYFESWDYDPSVRAMLVMLADIEKQYQALASGNVWAILTRPNNPLLLYMLDMKQVGLPDDLYIKMNSRGKPLTDFEYFKAGFMEMLPAEDLCQRFENSVDGSWAEFIWDVLHSSRVPGQNDTDLALIGDACFLRLINYITDIQAYVAGLPFTEINASPKETAAIYGNRERVEFLFDALDHLAQLYMEDPGFWARHFYYEPGEFGDGKIRFYFQNKQVNLVKSCLLSYEKNDRRFSLPEQLILYACILQCIHQTDDFNRKIRIIRNLVINSDNELRINTIGKALQEVQDYMLNNDGDIGVFSYFKKDQIQEEKDKQAHLEQQPRIATTLYRLEDSSLLRGCISLFDLNDTLESRSRQFLSIFKEENTGEDWRKLANLLLCFGDYTQDDGELTNVLSGRQSDWRKFFTTPAYNKQQLFDKTKPVLMACLDYFEAQQNETPDAKIQSALAAYMLQPKDWKYYFLRYGVFRQNCNQGYCSWRSGSDYVVYKMKERQFNGYHWDPFLEAIKGLANDVRIELNNYGGSLKITVGYDLLSVSSFGGGFLIQNLNDASQPNPIFDRLVKEQIILNSGQFGINQDNGTDLEDRIEKGVEIINKILQTSG